MRETVIPLIDYGIYQPPVIEPYNPQNQSAEFAYTSSQRQWYMKVYGGRCAFPRYDEQRGFFRCNNADRIEAHHVTPSAWIKTQFPHLDPNSLNIDYGLVGILLCHSHHDDVIHPDIGVALANYYANKHLIEETIENHRKMATQSRVFWNNDFDEMLRRTAVHFITLYMRNNPSDKYPRDVSWGKRPHLKQRSWTDGFF